MNNFWSTTYFWRDFWRGVLDIARNAAIVGGVALFVLVCYWAVVSSQKWQNNWPPDWTRGRKK